jgi:hypothetical protein
LGEFSPNGWLFTSGSVLKITEVWQIFGLLFTTVPFMYKFGEKIGWATFSLTHLVTLLQPDHLGAGDPEVVTQPKPQKPPIPWRSILTSIPVWSILVAHCCQNWGFYTLLTELPTYMKQILHYDIKTVRHSLQVFFEMEPARVNRLGT